MSIVTSARPQQNWPMIPARFCSGTVEDPSGCRQLEPAELRRVDEATTAAGSP